MKTAPIFREALRLQSENAALKEQLASIDEACVQADRDRDAAIARAQSDLAISEKSRLEMARLLTLLRPQVAIWLAGTGELEEIDKALAGTPPTGYVKVEQLQETIELLTEIRRAGEVVGYSLAISGELTRLEALKEGK